VRALLFLAAALFSCPVSAEISLQILKELQQGGFVLYMRHASTDFSQNDTKMTGYEDCANQRNLTDKGRAEARAVGGQIRRLGIPIGAVLASPYCRTMETARLAFGKAEPAPETRGGPVRTDDPKRYDALKKILSTKTEKNLVIASHGNPFHSVAGPPYLAEGEIAVVRPQGNSKFTVVGRMRIEEWEYLP
jgi:phosphohistidine phosphatase SixA